MQASKTERERERDRVQGSELPWECCTQKVGKWILQFGDKVTKGRGLICPRLSTAPVTMPPSASQQLQVWFKTPSSLGGNMLRLGRLQLDVGQGPEDVRSGHGTAEWGWKQLGRLDVDFGGFARCV